MKCPLMLRTFKCFCYEDDGNAFLFFLLMKAEKCEVSAQLYRQSAHTEGQKEMLFRGLFMGEFSRFKRISSSFYSKNLLLYDRIAILIFGIVINYVNLH